MITRALDEDNFVAMANLDLSAAFNVVNIFVAQLYEIKKISNFADDNFAITFHKYKVNSVSKQLKTN